MLDVRRLRALRALADHGTIAAAADALHLTPSAVSQQLAALGRDVGRPVVERDGRGVRLTPAATVLLAHADELLSGVERLQADLDAGAGAPSGEVRVAGFATALSGLVAPAAGVLAERAPAVELVLEEAELPEAMRMLGAARVDVLLGMEAAGAPSPDDGRWRRVELLRDVLDVALPGEDGPADVPLEDLARERWVMPPSGWTCEEVVTGACRVAGFSPRIAHRTGDWHVALTLVAAGLGVAMVPRLAGLRPPAGVRVVPLAEPAPCRRVFAACRRGAEARPAVRAVLDALGEAARRQERVAVAA